MRASIELQKEFDAISKVSGMLSFRKKVIGSVNKAIAELSSMEDRIDDLKDRIEKDRKKNILLESKIAGIQSLLNMTDAPKNPETNKFVKDFYSEENAWKE